MNLGNYKSTTWNRNVNADKKRAIFVNARNVETQSVSRARGGRMDLDNTPYKVMQSSNRDTYQ